MMKKSLYILFISLSLTLASCNSTDVDVNEHKATILKNLNEQKTSWNKGDIPAFMEHYWQSDSMAFMSKSGIRYGWKETLDAYKKGYPTQKEMGKLDFEVKKLDILSNETAYMLGAWKLERDTLDVGGHFSLIWKKVNGKWVIVTDHTS